MFLKAFVPIYMRKAITLFSYAGIATSFKTILETFTWMLNGFKNSVPFWTNVPYFWASKNWFILLNLFQLFFFLFLENALPWAKVAKFDISLNYPAKALAFSVYKGKTYNIINNFSPGLHFIWKTLENMFPTKQKNVLTE